MTLNELTKDAFGIWGWVLCLIDFNVLKNTTSLRQQIARLEIALSRIVKLTIEYRYVGLAIRRAPVICEGASSTTQQNL